MYTVVRQMDDVKGVGMILKRNCRSIGVARKIAYENLDRTVNGYMTGVVEIYDSSKGSPFSVGELVGTVEHRPIYGGRIVWIAYYPDTGKVKARYVLSKSGNFNGSKF